MASPVANFEAKYAPIQASKKEAWALAQLAEAEKSEWILAGLGRIENSQGETAALVFETLGNILKELQELQRPTARVIIQLSEIHDGLERDTRARILKAISPIPYSMHHKHARKGRLKGSGEWLLEKTEYQSWRESDTSSVLWLHGIPGSGKTKLTSLVVDQLEKRDNLAYFYCMRNPAEPQRGRCDQILASLVRQLARTSSDKPILPPVVAQYEEAIAGLTEFEDQAWTAEESGRVLLELMGEYPAATIVLDALDEVNQEDRQELLDILSGLLQDSPNLLKIFISSRDNYDIALHFEGSPNVYIEADDNARDISSFMYVPFKNAGAAMMYFRQYLWARRGNVREPVMDDKTTKEEIRKDLDRTFKVPALDVHFGFAEFNGDHYGVLYSCIGGTSIPVDISEAISAALETNEHPWTPWVTVGLFFPPRHNTINPCGG